MERFPEPSRPQTRQEELANSISHGLGAAGALVSLPLLIGHAREQGGRTSSVVGAAVFGAAALLLYLASALYHALPQGKAKRAVRIVEHSAIFLLIAGTYTPFTLGVLRDSGGGRLASLVWGLAAAGVALEIRHRTRFSGLAIGLYLAMGWSALLAIRPLLALMPRNGLLLLVLGGVSYTAGLAFYGAERLRYGHFVWHLFVLAGTAMHFCAVLWYAG